MGSVSGGGAALDRDALAGVLEKWRELLIDLSARNKLLNFKHTAAATLELEHPSIDELLGGLGRGMGFVALPEGEPGADAGARRALAARNPRAILTQKTTGPALNRALKMLRTKATQAFNDYGMWTLQIGVGMLTWRDEQSAGDLHAPLVLVPALIEVTDKGEYRLRINSDDEPRHNPALSVKLERLQVNWAEVVATDPMDVSAVLAAARRAVGRRPGWSVSERKVLAQFASHKEAMYQDLLDNRDAMVRSDLVRAVALGPYANLAPDHFDFDALDLDRIDELSPPEQTPLVLDADASQHQAVAAAVAGRSFVLDGPPGTGKSQTITNMIAGLLHAGRTVLFVSEKAAALDVVLDRLRATGLDSYALALHSHNTSRKAVAYELGEALVKEPSAPELAAEELSQSRARRTALNEYSAAMNEVRAPLGASLHDVIGMVGRLSSLPFTGDLLSAAGVSKSSAANSFRPDELTSAQVRSIVDAAETTATVWPAMVDPTYVWRELRPDVRNPRLVVERARGVLGDLLGTAAEYRELTGGRPAADDTALERLAQLLALVRTRPMTPESWLTSTDFADIGKRVAGFERRLREVGRLRDVARTAGGKRFDEMPGHVSATVPLTERSLAKLVPAGANPAGRTEPGLRKLSAEFAEAADRLDDLHTAVLDAGRAVGKQAPATADDVRNLCSLLRLTLEPHRPLGTWLDPKGIDAVTTAASRLLADRLDEFCARRDEVRLARDLAVELTGTGWSALSPELSGEVPPSETELCSLSPAGLDISGWSRDRIGEIGVRLDVLHRTVSGAADAAAEIATALGCDEPSTTEQAEDLITLVRSAAVEHRALAEWFEPGTLLVVRDLIDEIADATAALDAAERAAEAVFRAESVTGPEIPAAIATLEAGPRGLGGLFTQRVRAARRAVGSSTVSGTWRRDLYEQLPLASTWHAAHDRLQTLLAANADLLGHYVRDGRPDIGALYGARAQGELIGRLAPRTLADPLRRARIAGVLAAGREVPAELRRRTVELADGVAIWRTEAGNPPLADHAGALLKQPLTDVALWLWAHLEPLRLARDVLDRVGLERGLSGSAAAAQTPAQARTAIHAAHSAQRLDREFDAQRGDDRRLLGPWYRGVDTELDELTRTKQPIDPSYRATELLRGGMIARRRPRPYTEYAAVLGRYATDLDTDALWRAVDTARTAIRLAPEAARANSAQHEHLAAVVADGGQPRTDLVRVATEIEDGLQYWERRASAKDFADFGGDNLARLAPGAAARWLRAHLEPFEDAADMVRDCAGVLGADRTVGKVRKAIVAVTAARHARSAFEEQEAEWRDLLGPLYAGIDTDAAALKTALEWVDRVRRTVRGGGDRPLSEAAATLMCTSSPDQRIAGLHRDWKRCRAELTDCFEPTRAVAVRTELEVSLTRADALLTALCQDELGPDAAQIYARSRALMGEFGLETLAFTLAKQGVTPGDLPATVERMVCNAWVEHHLAADPRLRPHRAADRDRLVAGFRTGDEQLVRSAHATVIAACNERRPRRIGTGPAGILRQEAQKRAKHMPVRVLLGQTREVVQRIKPCFMMSPLTVSQFLPADFRFDVVIFDEASQVLPQDAVNSIYRGDALIVAGDQKQLPPTSFFTSIGGDEDTEWSEDDTTVAYGSVLDMCKGSGVLPSLGLRWHYRSRHEHLIAFSNHEFYDESMTTFPGVLERGPDIGVEFFHAKGVYGRGRRRDNPIEADVVAQRVMHHAQTRPHLTLGVVALSKPQADAIDDAVQRARADRPDLDHFFTEDRLDGFFVKNLETVQGDERDVIVLSVGYGRDEQGTLRSVFGPINTAGGWRRLNVAVTRARRRMEVVASFHGAELPDSANVSVQHLKRYLMFAETGPALFDRADTHSDQDDGGPFEKDVIDVLRGWGYSVQPRVGVAAYRVDLAVRHPRASGVFALGIECDGRMYHSSRAARDRDRLRQNILRDLGWRLHRIWGTDWHSNRGEALTRLRSAVEAACAIDPNRRSEIRPPAPESRAAPPTLESAPATVEYVPVQAGPPEWVIPYPAVDTALLADLRHRRAKELRILGVALQEPAAAPLVAEIAMRVVTEEGPVEEAVIIARLRTSWGVQRASRVVQDAIHNVLDSMVRERRIIRLATSYNLPGRTVTVVREPAGDYARRVGEVPPLERWLALRHIIADVPGAYTEEVLREVAAVFGWTRLGADIRSTLTDDIAHLVRHDHVEKKPDGRLFTTGR
ncbi:DUF3320 domain-containing protein [Nocardia sp. NPDC057668]|uniref:DUF3320 domain-containing protein n=1 Tax=Nocardia sp. NPDC057668 TaxID=3346202 RepID=UPI00366DF6E4